MSTSADNVDAGAGVVARTVSPDGVSTDPAHEPPPEDVSRSLFSDDEMIDPDDIPSQHICSFIQEPPINAVHFDVPNANGGLSEQVYEHLSLYRFIATPGMLRARRNVFHPHNQECVPRTAAMSLFRPATAVLQARLHRERQVLGYSLVDDNPLVDEHRELYAQTMRDSVERSIHESEVVVDLGGLSESESVVAMFSIPPLARPRPRVSNSNAASMRSHAIACDLEKKPFFHDCPSS